MYCTSTCPSKSAWQSGNACHSKSARHSKGTVDWAGTALIVAVTAWVLLAPTAQGKELLEKAIYTEETVGDLDKAIEIYQQVLAETKEPIAAAAQAQFRIGVCYAKQGNDADATAAFQAVIDKYPTATDWVAKSKMRLSGEGKLLPVPCGEGDEMHMEMKLPNGLAAGYQVYRVAKTEKKGKPYWECSAWQTVVLNGATGKSHVVIDHDSFAPLMSRSTHSLLGEADARYQEKQVDIKLASKDKPVTLETEGPVYDNEQAAELFRRLPLKVGYKANLNIIATLTATKLPLGVEVKKIETIETPHGEYECFKLDLSIGQTFWVSTDAKRLLVRFAAGGVTADLVKVREFKKDGEQARQPTTTKHDRFTVTLPPDWHAYTPATEKDKTMTYLINPSNTINARIETRSLEEVDEEERSAKAWAARSLKDYEKHLKGLNVDEAGIVPIKIGDREGVTVTGTFKEDKKQMSVRWVVLTSDTNNVNIRFMVESDELSKWQTDIDQIVRSLSIE